ncbi:hypothetical protein C8J57DRAFT_1635929 [Mycena rebaudengoi]|nr:hypothetical protein C8J57DRAFT_1635929 [Mycena rebaudengoi]
MHPALSLNSLSRLPVALRKFATSAANGSDEDLRTVLLRVQRPPVPHQAPLIALFCANLDPRTIPSAADLDTELPHPQIVRAFLSIGPIHSIPVPPPAAHSELWARIWPWMEFIFTYGNSLPNLPPEYTICSTFLEFLAQTQLKWGASLVESTPRVRVLVASAWVRFTERGDMDGLNNVAHFIFRDTRTDAVAWMDEYVEGAGTLSNLALAVVQHLQLAVEIQPLTASNPASISAGLLRAIISSTTTETDNVHRHLNYYLTTLLPRSLVYRGVLRRLDKVFHVVKDLAATPGFQRSRIANQWQTFTELAGERIEILHQFESRKIIYRACDYAECGLILEKHQFKRCASCLEFYYCSDDCQSLDWNISHRRVCLKFLALRKEELLSSRDMSFLSALVHSDYLASKSDIFAQKLLLLKYALNKPFFTSFDYSRGRVSIHVNPIPTPLEATESARWKDLAARAERNAGRLDLQWVAVREGPELRARLFRMRSAHGYIQSELVALARTLSLAEDLTQIAAKLSSAAVTDIFDIDVLMAH